MGWFTLGKLALGAFGALQSAKAAKAQANASQTDLKKLRDDAEAAGFNPLTVLRATGGQGFNKGASGALASATFWGSFANAGVSALNEFDPYNQKRKQLDLQQAQASLANTKASIKALKTPSIDDRVPLMRDGKVLTDRYGQTIYTAPEGTEAVPMYINVHDQNTGQVFPIINPELTEAGPTEMAAGMGTIAASKAATEAGTSVDIGPLSWSSDPMGFNKGITIRGWGNSVFATPKLQFP